MVIIPLSIFFIIYILFLGVFVVFSLIHLYHIIASASLTAVSFFITFILVSFTVITLFLTFRSLVGTNWKTPVTIFNSAWFSGVSSPPSTF